MTTPADARPFLPAAGTSRRLRFYDPFTRLLGVGATHWRLLVQAGPEPGHTVLEIGCGTGSLTVLAKRAEPAATVLGIDPDPDALALAERKTGRAGLEVGYRQAYADDLPQPDASVDRVLSSFMLHHVPADERLGALREARRVLRPGGRFHLVDIEGGEPVPAMRFVLGAVRALGRGHAHERGHGHGHEQGHGHGPGHGPDVRSMLEQAGFVDVVDLGAENVVMGGARFWRASA